MRSTITTADTARRLLRRTRPALSRGGRPTGSADPAAMAIAVLAVPVMFLAGTLAGPGVLPGPGGDRTATWGAPLGDPLPTGGDTGEEADTDEGTGNGDDEGGDGTVSPDANGWQ
ncbi:hypothetical protein GCM10027160_07460 [Streptomyces calidiresistens]|uniref:Uncharacterized protein n=1 Tax=Streptomyces calidiresistens TaxID=1485586 RepID=A0A7W3XZK9_9ACTN|nr:hypothetical protein [Streptomyces calidiresistens]MBB0233139.1 hypothetical protein [Streptomyces calidiresistens]